MTDTMFPFGLSSSLAFYVAVYVLTLVVHAFFMTYVLAGSIYLVWATIFPGDETKPRTQQPLAMLLRDWMPFVLSAAITAGVAPLLFVQVIYRQEFYTANLLLGWRWLVVIPALVAGFYLLYLVKSRIVVQWNFVQRSLLAAGIAVCFLFVAFCWTANHLISVDAYNWANVYASGKVIDSVLPLAARLATWVSGAFPVMCTLAGWQLIYLRSRAESDADSCDAETVRLAYMSLLGLILAIIFSLQHISYYESSLRMSVLSAPGWPWLAIAIGGIVMQASGWLPQLQQKRLCSRRLSLVTAGAMLSLLGTAALREFIRVQQVGAETIQPNGEQAAAVGGFTIFLLFTIVNAGLIAWCLKLAKPGMKRADQASAQDDVSPQ